MKRTLCVSIFLICLYACETRKPYPEVECGTQICNSPIGVGWTAPPSPDWPYFGDPVFNPNDPYHIIYFRVHNGVRIERYNLITKSSSVLLSNELISTNYLNLYNIDWSSSGWLVITGQTGGNLFKIREDGSQFQMISTNNDHVRYPGFSYDGTRLFYKTFLQGQWRGIFMDINTNQFLDTISTEWYYPSTGLANNKIVSVVGEDSIGILNENLQPETVFKPDFNEPYTTIEDIANIGNNTSSVAVLTSFGLYRIDLASHAVTLIKASCDTRIITRMDVSPDGNKIVYSLMLYYAPDDPCEVTTFTEIHTMNIDGTNDVRLDLP